MKQNMMLTIASLLSILLLTLHITDDMSVGYRRPSPQTLRWPFSWCCCTGRWCSPNGDRGTPSCCSSGCSRQPRPGGPLRPGSPPHLYRFSAGISWLRVARAEWRWLLAVALVSGELWSKLRLEKKWMRAQFGESYGAYSRRVAALMPYIIRL